MKKEDIIQYVDKVNGTFIGYMTIPFPIYVVHIAYDSVDSNPFFPLYKALLRYMKTVDKKLENLAYYARILGFNKELLDHCIKTLKEEGMIRYEADKYVITQDAENKFLKANSRPIVRISGSFIIDGKSLNLLPQIIYENPQTLNYKDENAAAHKPIDLALNTAIADMIIKLLNKPKNKKLLHIEEEGDNFEILDFDKKYLIGAYAVLYLDENKKYKKEVLYYNDTINCEAIGDISTYTFEMKEDKNKNSWQFHSNLGYNISDKEYTKNMALYTNNSGWGYLLSKRYQIENAINYKIGTEENTKLPYIILEEDLVENSENPLQIITDARTGFIDFDVYPSGIVRITIKNELNNYVEFMDELDKILSENNIKKETIDELSVKYNNWRNIMIKFKLYNELEKIDCDCFIKTK